MLKSLTKIITRDLDKLKNEINAYTDESKIWATVPGINNSAGNLCLHMTGNLKHYIGATLGNTGYVRDRDSEFTQKNIPRHELLRGLDEASEVVKNTLAAMNRDDLDKPYPIDFYKLNGSTEFYLIHFSTHLNYHLGQINYHRRVLG
ncbi:MAG: DinB family protein [bacterium]